MAGAVVVRSSLLVPNVFLPGCRFVTIQVLPSECEERIGRAEQGLQDVVDLKLGGFSYFHGDGHVPSSLYWQASTLVVLHLFSGRRRSGDLQDWLDYYSHQHRIRVSVRPLGYCPP